MLRIGVAAGVVVVLVLPGAVVGGAAASTSGVGARGAVAAGVVGTAGHLASRGPTPVATEGGHAVRVAPRWWPRGRSKPSAPWNPLWPRPVEFSATRAGALSGLVIALDPGHDIGNRNHVRQINQKSWVGLTKTCNTTGTATNAGYPEATFTFDVVARLRRLLVANGATVVVTRDRNTASTYGPCVGARGAFPAQVGADFMVSVHADGGPARGRGFHAIVPALYPGYTDDIARESRVLGTAMLAGMSSVGFPRSTYLSKALSIRKDQGGLNTSDVPITCVETLNMRNAADARIASTPAGRQKVAKGLYAGIQRYARTR